MAMFGHASGMFDNGLCAASCSPYVNAQTLQQDTTDATPLSGLATFGGFWTFVNGAFALLFGANIVYFASGRRPLSALGIIHVFQRTKLEKQWHADFPALHTEGGLPGSESAGIVAFIRERLIDVGETLPDGDHDPSKSAVDHLESLRSTPEVRTSLMVEESGVIPREDEDEESKVQGIPLSEKNLTWRMCDVRAEIV